MLILILMIAAEYLRRVIYEFKMLLLNTRIHIKYTEV